MDSSLGAKSKLSSLLLVFLSIITVLNATSLPVGSRGRHLLLYPSSGSPQNGAAVQLQPVLQIPQANTADRIDVDQKGPFAGRIQNPHELFLVYPNQGPIPGRGQSPTFNEIYPNVQFRPAIDPNAAFLPTKPSGAAGPQPGIEPDAVLISNLRPGAPQVFQPGQIYFQDMQPNPGVPSPGGGYPYPGFVGAILGFFGAAQPENPNKETIPNPVSGPEEKPMKIQSEENKEDAPSAQGTDEKPSKIENLDKPDTAGEQEILAAADRNPALPQFPPKPNTTPNAEAQKPNGAIPAVQPGQRFYILNGQPQFYTYNPIAQLPYQPYVQTAPQNLLYLRNRQQQVQAQQELFQRPNIRQQENQLFFQPGSEPFARDPNQRFVVSDGQNIPQGFKLSQSEGVTGQAAETKSKVPTEHGQGQVLLLPQHVQNQQAQPELNRESGQPNAAPLVDPNQIHQFYGSRQVFASPFLLRSLGAAPAGGANSGPNPGDLGARFTDLPQSNQAEQQLSDDVERADVMTSDDAALAFARYISERQQEKQHAEAISSPQEQRHENVDQ